jgi:preprotein translocase subunit SecE
MARDRQRAKQRKARRAAQNPGPPASEPRRSNVPGEIEHASGEADEFDAALVAGAGGREADEAAAEDRLTADGDADLDEHLTADEEAAEEAYEEELEDEEELAEDEEDRALAEDEEDRALAEEAVAAAPAARGRRREPAGAHRAEAAPRRSGPARFMAFLRASWAELQRVQWPDRRQVAQATAVVLGFVVVAGLDLGVADRVAQELVDLII